MAFTAQDILNEFVEAFHCVRPSREIPDGSSVISVENWRARHAARQSRYYQRNKDRINAAKREARRCR